MLSKERINKSHDRIYTLREQIERGRRILDRAWTLGAPEEATKPVVEHINALVRESAEFRKLLRQKGGM